MFNIQGLTTAQIGCPALERRACGPNTMLPLSYAVSPSGRLSHERMRDAWWRHTAPKDVDPYAETDRMERA